MGRKSNAQKHKEYLKELRNLRRIIKKNDWDVTCETGWDFLDSYYHCKPEGVKVKMTPFERKKQAIEEKLLFEQAEQEYLANPCERKREAAKYNIDDVKSGVYGAWLDGFERKSAAKCAEIAVQMWRENDYYGDIRKGLLSRQECYKMDIPGDSESFIINAGVLEAELLSAKEFMWYALFDGWDNFLDWLDDNNIEMKNLPLTLIDIINYGICAPASYAMLLSDGIYCPPQYEKRKSEFGGTEKVSGRNSIQFDLSIIESGDFSEERFLKNYITANNYQNYESAHYDMERAALIMYNRYMIKGLPTSFYAYEL